MANQDHVDMINKGPEAWNAWRASQGDFTPDFSNAFFPEISLSGANLSGADFSNVRIVMSGFIKSNLSDAKLVGARFSENTLIGANLTRANLAGATFTNVNFSDAILTEANLSDANLYRVDFTGAFLTGAILERATFFNATFCKTSFSQCHLGQTAFNDVDFSEAQDLESVSHFYPSSIGIDTLFRSGGKISDIFLRDCGVPDDFITNIPSLFDAMQAIHFYSCFISYGTKDEEFAKRLHSRMQAAKLRVWFAPEDMKGGKKIFDQIDTAIRVYDKLLLLLSEESIKSEWVITEIRKALKAEKRENRRKLFPIRLINYERLKEWELPDPDTGRDLAVEIRSYYIPDFSNWKDHDSFEAAFAKLLKDLKAEE
jgi:uncharacterized protein YjbI with pentapeptide repeats